MAGSKWEVPARVTRAGEDELNDCSMIEYPRRTSAIKQATLRVTWHNQTNRLFRRSANKMASPSLRALLALVVIANSLANSPFGHFQVRTNFEIIGADILSVADCDVNEYGGSKATDDENVQKSRDGLGAVVGPVLEQAAGHTIKCAADYTVGDFPE